MSSAPRSLSLQQPWVSALYAAGLVSTFIGERLLGAGSGRLALTGGGLALVVLALAWRTLRLLRSSGDWRVLERWFLGLYLVGTVGLGLYFAQSDVAEHLWGGALAQKAPRLSLVLAALFPALVACSLLPLALVELSAASMSRVPVLEKGRVRTALFSGLGLAFTLVFAFSSLYVATQADHTWDLSYFRTARPGEATRKLVRALNEPLQVTLFFPPANDVGQAVEQYVRDLTSESAQLKVELLDQAVEPVRARELGVSTNGTLVLAREARREMLTLPLELDRARGQLQRLDQEVYRRLRQVARPRQVLYFTAGHGERDISRARPEMQGARPPVSDLAELLRSQNVEVRTLSLAEGLGVEVPRDATLVAVVGPTKDFLAEELNALREYAERGGRLWLALEPDGPALEPLLKPLGVRLLRVPLANDQVYFRLTRQQSDRGNLGVSTFSSHPSVSTLSSLAPQAAVALLGATALEPISPAPAGVSTDVSVRSHEATFQDANGDFALSPGEQRSTWPLVVAAEKPAAPGGGQALRAVIMGDADALSDGVLGNPSNAYFAVDTLRWLTGEEALAGANTSEEDVIVQHTRKQDVVWFYATVFLAPAVVLGAGFFPSRGSEAGVVRPRSQLQEVRDEGAQSLAFHGALAAAGLVAALLVWQKEPAGAPGEVVVVDASKRALERIRYEDATRWVELYRDAQDEDVLWVQLGSKPVPPPVAGADAGTPPPPPPPPPPRELRANEMAQKLFARFAPLRASRGLGKLEDSKLAEVGLKDSPRRLTLKLASGEQAFTVATPAGGWGSPYLRREADGSVFLLGPALLPDLEAAASRLVDRTLHGFDASGYDTLVVTQGSVSRTYVVSGSPQPGPVALAPQATPDKPDEFARNWHDKVWRLTPVDFLGRGEEPAGGSPEVLFRVEYQRGGKSVGELTVARSASGEFLLRTERTPGWARLTAAVQPLATEATKVAGGGS